MRFVKLKPSDLRKQYTEFYTGLNATNGTGRSFCGYVFLSEEDDAKLRRNNRRLLRKDEPRAAKAVIDKRIEFLHANVGPNQLLAKALRPGYALVDDEGIANSIETEQAERLKHQTTVKEEKPSFFRRIRDSILGQAK